jgi:hypothetical protein
MKRSPPTNDHRQNQLPVWRYTWNIDRAASRARWFSQVLAGNRYVLLRTLSLGRVMSSGVPPQTTTATVRLCRSNGGRARATRRGPMEILLEVREEHDVGAAEAADRLARICCKSVTRIYSSLRSG